MFKKFFTKLLLAVAFSMQASLPAHSVGFDPVGQDIDIFLANPAFSASRPNVLILLDNTANWNNAFANEKSALQSVFGALDSSFNVGLMMFTETGAPNTGNDGAYVRFAVRQMTGTNQTALNGIVGGLDKINDKSNGAKYSLIMSEAYRYFAGIAADAGNNKAKTDYTGNTTYLPSSVSSTGNALSSFGGTTYNSPIVEACQKNFIILISNGPAGDNISDLTRVQTLLATLVGTNPPATISISPSGEQNLWTDELAKYMANNDCNAQITGVQKVITYTLDVDPITTGQGPSHTAMLKSTGSNGKGGYFAVSSGNGGAQIIDALNKIFNEVQAVNSAFVSATLPVSVNVRGTNINQVYIGLFRPDGAKLPRWVGNMKLYKLGLDAATGDLFTADANGTNIFSATTGFVNNTATSFWTTSSSFWSFKSPYAATDIGQASDSPDGDIVEKGGTAQRLRTTYATSQTARKVFTCTGSCTANSALSSTPFDTSNTSITAGALGTYLTQAVTSLTSVGTLATATVPAHGFSNGNVVTVTSATPPGYNGDFTISGVTTNTFQYTLAASSVGNLANLNKASHGLTTGNLITVSGASPGGYNVTDAPLTKVDANNVTYLLPGIVSSSATLGTVTIKKDATALSQIGTTVTATVPSHGYTSGQSITISGATPAGANGTFTVTSVVDLDHFKYTNSNAGAPSSTTAYATITNHPFSTGDLVTVSGATPSVYNGAFTITKIDANTISYTISSAQTGLATGTITLSSVGSVPVTSITHPTSGSLAAKNVGTVTTTSAHGFTTGQTVTIAGATLLGYNGAYLITVGTSTVFTYTGVLSALATPAAGAAITATGARTYSISALGTFTVAGGSIKSQTTLTGATISAQNIAVGSIRAGRKTDADTTDRANLINWVRGTDNAQDENANLSSTDARASIHGDVLHSKPQVVNYNRDGTENDVYVFYGANDGALRAVKGGFASDGGTENWAFVAPEFFSQLKRLRDNSQIIDPSAPKAYFFDGPISVYTYDANGDGKLNAADGDKVYVYMSMRRGGRYIYALDVSDPDTPKFMWKKGCPNIGDNVGCDTGYDELGQTWAEPQIGFVRASPTTPMLFVAGGYDPTVEDIQPCLITANTSTAVTADLGGVATFTSAGTCSTVGATPTVVNRTKGRGIFVINALTGAVFWRAGPDAAADKQVSGMKFAMPADLFVLNRDGDNSRTITTGARENVGRGFVDRIYAPDTGGNVWRVDIDPVLKTDWAVRQLASISASGAIGTRKFLYKVDAVAGSDPTGGFDAILVGSGDREHPFDATVGNRIYMFKDRIQGIPVVGATPPATITTADLYDATANDVQQTTGATQTAAKAALDAAQGWRIILGTGEKVTTNVVTVAGESFFNTNQPSSSASSVLGNCESNLGIARLYNVRFDDASAVRDLNGSTTLTLADRSQIKAGGGFAPPPVQVVVKIDGKLKEAVLTFPVPTTVTGPPRDARLRTYWKRKLD